MFFNKANDETKTPRSTVEWTNTVPTIDNLGEIWLFKPKENIGLLHKDIVHICRICHRIRLYAEPTSILPDLKEDDFSSCEWIGPIPGKYFV